jgi:anti-anti-sigma regulatory factor
VSKKKSPRTAQSTHIELDARLTIVQAADLRRTLAERLAGGGALTVDGSRVEEIDAAILQLLASLWRTSQDRGIACTWQGASDVLRRMANLIGLAEILHFPDRKSARGGSDIPLPLS